LVFDPADCDDNHGNRFGRGKRGLNGAFEFDTAAGVRWDAPEFPSAKGKGSACALPVGAQRSQWWRKGKIDNPSVTFITSDADWVAMSNGKLKGTWAFMTGRLKVRGSQAVARKLNEIFP